MVTQLISCTAVAMALLATSVVVVELMSIAITLAVGGIT